MPGHPYRRSGDASLRRAQRLWLAPALVVAGIATAAQVHAITFIEGADFPGSSGPTNPSVGTLGLGTNTVSGMLVGNCVPGDCNGPSAGDTQDSFILQIAAGQEATGVFMSSSNFSGPAGFTYSLSGLGGTGGTFAPNTSTGNLAGSPVASGSYQLSVFGQGASVAGPYSIDWLLQVDVATIGGVLPPPPPPGGITEISPVTEETAVTNVVPAAVIVQTGGEAATVIAQRFSSFVSKAIGGGRRGSPAGVPAVYVPGGGVPLAAGDVLQSPMGYWASYSRNNLRNNFSTTAFDGNVTNVIGGVDWTFGEDLLVGLAAGYEKQDFVTLFNGGTQQTDGIVVAPYAGWRINDQWSIDGTAGFAYNDVEQSRTQLAQTITSELDAWRVFAAGNVNWFGGRDRWLLSARAGVLYAQDSFDSFTENTGVAGGLFNPEREFDIGQASIGGEIGYAIGDFVPFVNGRFVYDVEESVVEVGPGQVSPGSDRTEFQAGFGLRYYSDNGISADVEFSTVETRSNIDSYTISATVRIDL